MQGSGVGSLTWHHHSGLQIDGGTLLIRLQGERIQQGSSVLDAVFKLLSRQPDGTSVMTQTTDLSCEGAIKVADWQVVHRLGLCGENASLRPEVASGAAHPENVSEGELEKGSRTEYRSNRLGCSMACIAAQASSEEPQPHPVMLISFQNAATYQMYSAIILPRELQLLKYL